MNLTKGRIPHPAKARCPLRQNLWIFAYKSSRRIVLIVLVIIAFAASVPTDHIRASTDPRTLPIIPSITGSVYYRARSLFRTGVYYFHNRADIFSKIGDSITAFPYFLTPVGSGGLNLGAYGDLQPAFAFFGHDIARTNNSFANESLGAYPGWTTYDLLDPAKAAPGICTGGTTPLDCELGVTHPSIALIMIGTNDLPAVDVNSFRYNLNRIVTITERHGVIPVISTLPRRKGDPNSIAKLDSFNAAIIDVAQAHAAPIWNYWLAMEGLPDTGISTDLVHPSLPADGNTAIFDANHLRYGWTMRNLTAMQVLKGLMAVVAK